MLKVEDALSCPSLPANLRDQLRLALALDVYFFAEPDITQLGTGAHLGTWNMRIGRVVGGTYGAALLPDHPLYDYWMSRYRDLDRYLLATSASPGGGWYEPPLYSMYGPQRWLAVCAQILRNTGLADLNANGYLTKFLQYNADLTLADPRYPDHRIPWNIESDMYYNCECQSLKGRKVQVSSFNPVHSIGIRTGV